jgi:hypothetical protein
MLTPAASMIAYTVSLPIAMPMRPMSPSAVGDFALVVKLLTRRRRQRGRASWVEAEA